MNRNLEKKLREILGSRDFFTVEDKAGRKVAVFDVAKLESFIDENFVEKEEYKDCGHMGMCHGRCDFFKTKTYTKQQVLEIIGEDKETKHLVMKPDFDCPKCDGYNQAKQESRDRLEAFNKK